MRVFYSKEFDSYRITYYTGYKNEALIQFIFKQQKVGSMVFLRNDQNIPQNGFYNDEILLYYPISRFNDIISILRLGKPLQITLSTDNRVGTLMTKP
jgi:hypothetical protein